MQLTALVFTVFQVLLMFWRYLTGWMLLLVFRWHDVQATVPLCCDLLLNVAVPLAPWHGSQYVVLGSAKTGLFSVLLWILPELWQSEQDGFVPGLFMEWLDMVLFAASMNGKMVDALLWQL